MAFKFLAMFALIAVTNAGLLPAAQVYHAAPATVVKTVSPIEQHYAAQPVLTKAGEEFDPHPQYHFGYNVHDNHSGDSKSQVEERDGDVVRGEYSLIDADGYKRTVKYTADDHNGFNAVVEREPLVKTVAAAPTVVKTVVPVDHYAAPSMVKTVSPIAHYASPAVLKTVEPIAHYTAPVSHYSGPAVVKTIAPAAHHTSPVVLKTVQPVAHYTSPVTHYSTPTVVKTVEPAGHFSAPVSHFEAPTVFKTVTPVAHYASPAVVKTVDSVAHYGGPAYTAYSTPAHYVSHH